MKYSLPLLSSFVSVAYAFPYLASISDIVERQTSTESNCGPIPCTTFSETDQFVDVRPGSKHAYVPSKSTDIRGPCPGLNAAANHGFLSHTGITTISETITGLGAAYGMGADLAGFLAAYAIALTGDPLTETWSIGGPYPGSPLAGVTGEPQGISYSHNSYEGDSSACRGDAYLNNGDAHSLKLGKFTHLYNLGTTYTLDLLQDQFAYNQNNSVTKNGYYFNAPFSGLLVAPAAHFFIINFMSNHSAANPNGYLDRPQLKTFFGVTGEPGSFVWNKGQEQIPQAWYRRPSSNPYSVPAAVADVAVNYARFPTTFKLGGNTGKPNTFTGVDVGGLTGGLFEASTLFNGNNFGCFVLQTAQAGLPDALNNVVADVTPALALLNKYLSPVLSKLNCPQLQTYNQGLFNQFPGYKYDPTGTATNYKAKV